MKVYIVFGYIEYYSDREVVKIFLDEEKATTFMSSLTTQGTYYDGYFIDWYDVETE